MPIRNLAAIKKQELGPDMSWHDDDCWATYAPVLGFDNDAGSAKLRARLRKDIEALQKKVQTALEAEEKK